MNSSFTVRPSVLLHCAICFAALAGACYPKAGQEPPASLAPGDTAGAPAPANACGASCETTCPSTQTACANDCVDTQNDAAHCGACGVECARGVLCSKGKCVAASNVCTPACSGGQVCVSNTCKCPETTAFCGGACVDTQSTPAHCGACGATCSAGALCQAGACVCPAGQAMCGSQCVDVQQSPQNCGACGKACATGETCMAGSCHSPLGGDGCSGAPNDLAVSEVAAFQSIKIPLSKGTAPIDPTQRVSLVQNRPTLFRVYVTPGSNFSARDFSARVTVKNGGVEDQYYAKQRISTASSEADTASTFQVAVPREKIQADTRYSVEVVQCSGAPAAVSGTPISTRLPITGDTPLAAMATGTLQVKVIPLSTNSHLPDTSDAALAVYRSYLEAMYPVDEIVLSVGEPQSVPYPINWNNAIEQLRVQRQADKPAPEVYYFGFLKPTDTLQEYCRRGCTAGVGYVGTEQQASTRVAVGLAYADEQSAAVMAHEIGHNHGRSHAPCAPGNQIDGVDTKYPYAKASTGVWGYDFRTKKFFDPAKTSDIMGYCDPKWISDYTYKGLLQHSADVNVATYSIPDPDFIQAYRVMLLDGDGPRWSQPFPEPEAPFGKAEAADVLDVDDQVIERVTVYRTTIGDNQSSYTLLVPEPKAGWVSIKVHDALSLSFAAPLAIPAPR